jgi:PKD repeat protein
MNRVSLTPPLRAASSVLQAGQPISITAQDSTDPDLDYIFYRWDWGDGRSLGAYDDNVIITSHTYAAAGTYTVTLTLTDNFGATAQATRQITIGAGNPNPAPAPTPTPPVTPPTPNTYVSTVPGVVQIESYMSGGAAVAYYDTTAANLGGAYRTTEGVDLEVADDVGGGYSLGYIEAGEWIKYQLTVSQPGVYAVQVRYAYPAGTPIAADRAITLLLDDNTVPIATLTAAPSGGWGVWQNSAAVTLNAPLTAGTHQITVQFTNGWWRVNYLTFTLQTVAPVAAPVAAPVSPPTPPANTIQLPGTVQAENYMAGAAGIAYYDTTPGNTGGALRNDDVDIAVCNDGAGCYSVDYLEQGEWLRYQVTLTQSGTYAITARYAYPAGTPVATARTLTLQLGTAALGTLSLAPATAGWDVWATSAALNTAALTAGTYQLTVNINQGWWRFNSLQFTLLTATPPPVTPVTPPIAPPVTPPVAAPVTAPVAAPVSPSVVTALPGLLQVENYRVGGQGVAYYDTTTGNAGGALRTDDVDLQTTNGEVGLGYIESGEWLTYQVTLSTAGTYRVQARYAYPPGTPVATNRQLRLFMDNSATPFVTLSLPPTGDWTTWTYSAGVQTLSLPAGSHVITMRLDYGYWTLDALQFTLITPTAMTTARRALRTVLADTTGPALYFTADTFVSSASADESSGTLPGLVVMNSDRGTNVALLQLNIDSIDDLAASARVRLFNPREVTPVNVTCHLVTSDAWPETLTWNSKVAWSDAMIDSQLVSNAGYYEWDITQLVQLKLAQGESTLSLALRTELGRVVFAAKEHVEISYRPALIGQLQARAEQIEAESTQYMRDGPDISALIPSTQLLVEGTTGTLSRAYVRYSIFNIPRQEVYRMRLFGAKIGTPGTCVTVRAYSADDSQWSGDTLTQQPQFGVMIASTVICDTEPRWYEWDISLYVRQQLTKDVRALTIGLDVTPLNPALSPDELYQSPERVVFDGVTHAASMPRLAFDINLHDFVYADEFVTANPNNAVFEENNNSPTGTNTQQPTAAPSVASMRHLAAYLLVAVLALVM